MTIQAQLHDSPVLEFPDGMSGAEMSASVENFLFGSTAPPMQPKATGDAQAKAHMRPVQLGGEVGR